MLNQNPNSQLTPDRETESGTKRKPAIRTMKTDLAELAQKPDVSVTKTVSEELMAHPSRVTFKPPRARLPRWIIMGAVLVLLAAGTALYFYLSGREPKGTVEPLKTPAPLFGVERTSTLTVRIQERLGFLRRLEQEVKDQKRTGTITGIFLKVIDGPQERFASLRDFAELMGFNAPSGLFQQFGSELMLFVYQGASRNHFGAAAQAKDAGRAFREMLLWEKTLPGDFFALLFDDSANTIGSSFEDKTYRNIDYRFAKLSPEKDLGVGYAVFPARKIAIITTGQEAMERIIDRLFGR